MTKQRLLALLNHRRRQALRGRRRRKGSPSVKKTQSSEENTTSQQEFDAIRVLLDSNIEETARVAFSETAREEHLRQRMGLLEDILLVSEDIDAAEKRLAEFNNEDEDRTEAVVLTRHKAEMETRLKSLQERLRLCDAVVDEAERALKDVHPPHNTDVVESLSRNALQTLVHDLLQRASDSRASELLANQSQEMSETRRELAIHARDTAWKELSLERKEHGNEIRRIHSTYQENMLSGESGVDVPEWITTRMKENETEIEQLKAKLKETKKNSMTSNEIIVGFDLVELPNIASDIGVSSEKISDSLREEISIRRRDHEKVWKDRRDILERCVENGLDLYASLRHPLEKENITFDEKETLLSKWNRVRKEVRSSFDLLMTRCRRLEMCTSEIVRMRKEFAEESEIDTVVPNSVKELALIKNVEWPIEKASFEILLSKNFENMLSFKNFEKIKTLAIDISSEYLCSSNASRWESEMRDLSIRRAKRLRDVKMLVESLRSNIKILGSEDGERMVRDHFEKDETATRIYMSVSDDRVFEITLSSKSFDILKETCTLLSSCVDSRRHLLKDYQECFSRAEIVLKSYGGNEEKEKIDEEKEKKLDRTGLLKLSKRLYTLSKHLEETRRAAKKRVCELYVETGKCESNALECTNEFWNEASSRADTMTLNRMNCLMSKLVCLVSTEDSEEMYGVYDAVFRNLFEGRSIRKRFLIDREYHTYMTSVSHNLILLEACREEEARLEDKIRSRKSILDQLSKVREMEAKMREFETMASDSSRLLRGSSLARLEEERFRVRYAKLHPKRLASIASAVEKWESENDGEVFMLCGVSLADAIEKVRQKLLPLELSLRGTSILGLSDGVVGTSEKKTLEKKKSDNTTKTKRRSSKDRDGKENKGGGRRRSGKGVVKESKIARPRRSVSRRSSGDDKKNTMTMGRMKTRTSSSISSSSSMRRPSSARSSSQTTDKKNHQKK